MTTLTAPAPTTHAFAAALDAGEITWAEIDMPAYAPAEIIPARTYAPAADLDLLKLSGAELRKAGFTPTGRERNTPAAAAARAEIARRRTNKLARRAA